MPGIFGLIDPHASQDRVTTHLEIMARSMRHRPDYHTHMHARAGLGLGRTGPSFLNPEPQPVFSPDRSCALVFQGELFDPDAVRGLLKGHALPWGSSDADIVLAVIMRHGPRIVAKLPGVYCGFFYDFRTATGHLFTDRMGLRPAYWTVTPQGAFLFAAEFKAVVALPSFHGTLDVQALTPFLNRGTLFLHRTFFREVQCLGYASVLTVKGGETSIERYWDQDLSPPPAHWTFQDAVEEGSRLFLRAVDRQFRQPGVIGATLSGGLDSRGVVAAAAHTGHRVPTYTLGFPGNIDARFAARVARQLNLPYHSLPVRPDSLARLGETGIWQTDGMFPCSHLHWMDQLGTIGSQVRAILSGHMGVNLGGCHNATEQWREVPHNQRASWLAHKHLHPFSPFLALALRPQFFRQLQEQFEPAARELELWIGDRCLGNEVERVLTGNLESRFINAGNAGMFGVVADLKYPYADYDLLDYAGALRDEWRTGFRLYQAILCRSFPEIIHLPYISAKHKHIPGVLRADGKPIHVGVWALRLAGVRKFSRFLLGRITGGRFSRPDPITYVHYAHWYRTVPALRQWVHSVLLDQRTLDRGYFDPQGLGRLLKMLQTKGYPLDFTACLITFEYWNRFFVDRTTPLLPDSTSGPADSQTDHRKTS